MRAPRPFSKKQVTRYLENPSRCPSCNSTNIEGECFDHQTGSVAQKISCNVCGRRWWDIYKLINAEAR